MSQRLLRHTEPTQNECALLLPANFTTNQSAAGLFDPGCAAPSSGPRVAVGSHPTAPPGRLIETAEANAIQDVDDFLIDDLGEGGYRVRQPLNVQIERIGMSDYKASFRDANIAISGTDTADAYLALVADILDTFDMLSEARALSPAAAEQLRILRRYIVKEEEA